MKEVEIKQNLAGGQGQVTLNKLLSLEQMDNKARMFAHVVIAKNSSIGYHEHVNESETYYILKGKGLYQDDGKEYEVNPGDVTFCGSHHHHGIQNIGDEDLEFIALILLGDR